MATEPSWHDSYMGNSGTRVELPCPMPSCPGEIIYNGNYFCSLWGYTHEDGRRIGGPCGWALSHNDSTGEPVGKRDRDTWIKIVATPFFMAAVQGRK